MAEQNYVFQSGETFALGTGTNDYVNISGSPVLDDDAQESYVYESGVPLISGGIPRLESPVDIAFTCDNSTIIYLNSLSNNLINDPASGGSGTPEWQSVETATGVELETGLNTFAMEGWNGPDPHGDTSNAQTTQDSSPIMYIGAIRDANGKVVVLSPASSMRIDTNGATGYNSSNPYGEDYAAPGFDDSAWNTPQYPLGTEQKVSTMNWQGSPDAPDPDDDTLDTGDFFGGDPYFTNHITDDDPRVAAGWNNRYWFFRWTVDNTVE